MLKRLVTTFVLTSLVMTMTVVATPAQAVMAVRPNEIHRGFSCAINRPSYCYVIWQLHVNPPFNPKVPTRYIDKRFYNRYMF